MSLAFSNVDIKNPLFLGLINLHNYWRLSFGCILKTFPVLTGAAFSLNYEWDMFLPSGVGLLRHLAVLGRN